MVDPISITTGVLSLLGTCYKIVSATKAFHDGMVIVDVKVTGLLSDVESFAQALQGLYNTLEEERVKATFQSTGHIGNLWMNLSKTITDGQNTLVQLQSTLDKINKTVGILDNARKQLRLNSSMAELAMFQQQIRSYRDTIQLTLQTFILYVSLPSVI
ncbi:uncharacterized protein LY89DRAFT_428184 [Mollisia scopiformis]|uniref:Fungal N-terminal domain-containing protein n=1 Tax=Mollisia scopiformis TaxID=149040 RepID=A0A194XLN7_MOLSC|nr:uncharacterized protein LY89DRAFT_428184 [Mollisia scopiformis]KUJ21160.1 hypothetical protein LY89DRAFT_428184 [Mollisia scopiformis]